ncbi:PQQ-binding-like beta-propeller repeat protein [Sphingomonas daechungensis]|uniref:outer membrane protein assembly factor BamB family protein n=1 Tax=Sphingomonas daechungensis TaxID=1176646 RepID=UPI003782FD7D
MRRSTIAICAALAMLIVIALVGSTLIREHQPDLGTSQYGTGAAEKAIPAPSASPPDDGNWTMPGKDYASTRFSGLRQVTPQNVSKLQVAFTFSTGTTEGFEAPPLVVNNTMYVIAPWPNNVFALDLTRPGAPAKWIYEPRPAAAAKGVACCGPVNRGAFYLDGRLYMNLLDGNTVAIDADSGKEIWRTKLGDIQKGETITMAPLVAEGKVLVGNSGGEMGVRGWLAALDAGSGKLAWKAYSTAASSHGKPTARAPTRTR